MRYLVLALIVVGTCAHAQDVTYDVSGTVTSEQLTLIANNADPVPQSPVGFYGTLGQQVSFGFVVDTATNTVFNGGGLVEGGAGFSSSFNPSPLTASATAYQTSFFKTLSFNLAGDQLQVSESASNSISSPSGNSVDTFSWAYITNITNLVISAFDSQTGAPVTVGAPEMDPSSATSALTLLLGGLAVFRSRMNRNREHSPAN